MIVFDQQDENGLAARMAETAAHERRLAILRDGKVNTNPHSVYSASRAKHVQGQASLAAILQQVRAGVSRTNEIAAAVGLSPHTVRNRMHGLYLSGAVAREKCPRHGVWIWSMPKRVV